MKHSFWRVLFCADVFLVPHSHFFYMKLRHILPVAGLMISLSSCKTYYISVDSFRQQFAGLDTSKLKIVITKDPWGHKSVYKTYPVESVLCTDQNGNKFLLKNGPSIEIRFTENNGKKTVFYFDRILLVNDTVTGIRSRFIPSFDGSIPLKQVKAIEIQDGGKKYTYVN